MTSRPISLPLAAADGQASFGEFVEERPWLIGVAGAVVLAGLLAVALRSRRRR